MTLNGWFQILLFFAAIAAVTVPLGRFMSRVFARDKTWLDPVLRPMERAIYRLSGVDETHDMRWTEYGMSMLAFSLVSMLVLYLMMRLQAALPFNPQQLAGVAPDLAFNTSASFTTNTNWQSYVGETTMSYLTQMAGLAYHNFVSAAVGIALAIAFIRGIASRERDSLGNFWVDMTRATLWVLLPFCIVGALLLVSQGVVQNLKPYDRVQLVDPQTVTTTDADGKETSTRVTEQVIAQGPVASQEIIKEWGTNGGGFFNANSAHPLREPDAVFELPRDVRDLRDLVGPDVHAGRHDAVASPWVGRVGRHGGPVLRRGDHGVLGRGGWQSAARREPIRPRVRCARAATWRARKRDSGSPIPRSSPPSRPMPVAARSTRCTTPSRLSAAWCRLSTSCSAK